MTRVIDVAKGEHHQAKEPLDPFDVIRLARRGYTAQEAADELGYAMWTVRNTAREVGVKFRDPRAFTEGEIAIARALRGQGMTYRQIAHELGGGKSPSGVRKVLLRDD